MQVCLMSKAEQLIEYIICDVIEYHVLSSEIDMKEAMSQFYNSEVFKKLGDVKTELYLASSSYIYDLFLDELIDGRIVQKEV